MIRTTHTVALMQVSPETYTEIKQKLEDAGYDHAVHRDGTLDMTGIGLSAGLQAKPEFDQSYPVENFYGEVAFLLDTTHEYSKPPTPGARLRWGPRNPGNGRYPGHGVVRKFSKNHIHVALHTPKLSGWFTSQVEALNAISQAVERARVRDWFFKDFTRLKGKPSE